SLIYFHCACIRSDLKHASQAFHSSLPVYLSDQIERVQKRVLRILSVTVVRVKSKDNSLKDLLVRREKVADALLWLKSNYPYYKDVKIDQYSLNCLPKHGIPHDVISVEIENEDNQCSEPDLGPQNEEDISTYSTHDPIFVLGFEYDLEKAHSAAKGILLKQNPGQAYLTIEELQQMAANN
ncbi:unnamed protein product, partial [Pocillopora meandrina]